MPDNCSLKVTCQRPQEREKDIMQTVRHNAYYEDPYAKEFGIKISEKLAQVEAHILPPHGTVKVVERERDCLPQVRQWNMMNKKMVNGGTVNDWMCFNFSCDVQDSTFNTEPILPPYTACPDHVERALKTRYSEAMTKLKGKELDLLIVILLTTMAHSMHVLKMSKQYLAKVAFKINVNVGGRNTVLVDALSRHIPLVSDRRTIIFGADVTHPHPGEYSSPSIAVVTSNLLVLLWSQHYQPPVTFVVVQKRHHTSFVFANNHNDHQTIDRSGNILPGTMVDSKICHPTEFDFYFCSHAVFRYRPDTFLFSFGILGLLLRDFCISMVPWLQMMISLIIAEHKWSSSLSPLPTSNAFLSIHFDQVPDQEFPQLQIVPTLCFFRARFYMEPETPDSGSMRGTVARGGTGWWFAQNSI
ncbi:hypothetical protein MKX03_020731 [Papaver bracteatum]|nr:hypothetical protein MKX03_020731 [Papaver bracteatum]